MIQNTNQIAQVVMAGGLDYETPALSVQPGRMLSCKNYEVNTLGGYTRVQGYERFDGQPSPTESVDKVAARALIQAVPGSGPIRGVHVYKGEVYAFRDTADGLACKMHKATATGWTEVTTPALNPGGRYDCRNYNFQGAASSIRMMGVDSKNHAFIFDGTTFTQITIAGETGFPSHLAAHYNHLFLSFPEGQLYHSGIGEPTDFDINVGAGLIGTGDEIVELKPTVGGALAVMMRNRTSILYGSDRTEWSKKDLRAQDEQIGAVEWSVQTLFDLFYLDDRGLTSLTSSQNFGNFESGTVSTGVNPFLRERKSKVKASCIVKRKNQYRIFFESNSFGCESLTLTFKGGQIMGYGRSALDHSVECIVSSEDTEGNEVIYFGSDDGFVYQLDKGTSFDGKAYESFFRLAFNHLGMPRNKKRFREAILGIQASTGINLKVKPEFNYGDSATAGHRVLDIDILGGGGVWDVSEWNDFVWSSQVLTEGRVDISGIGRSLSLVVYSKSDVDEPHTIFDFTLKFSMRGLHR